jgi:hypothetical protein
MQVGKHSSWSLIRCICGPICRRVLGRGCKDQSSKTKGRPVLPMLGLLSGEIQLASTSRSGSISAASRDGICREGQQGQQNRHGSRTGSTACHEAIRGMARPLEGRIQSNYKCYRIHAAGNRPCISPMIYYCRLASVGYATLHAVTDIKGACLIVRGIRLMNGFAGLLNHWLCCAMLMSDL